MIQKFFIITVFLLLLGCEKNDNEENIYNPRIILDNKFLDQLYSEAYDTLNLVSGSYVLDAFLWRDFQPFCPSDGRPLCSVNRLINVDSTEIPAHIDMVKQYVINKDSVWITDYYDELPQVPKNEIEKVSIGGPKWGPKIYIDIVSQIHDSLTNSDFYLLIRNVYIGRTD